MRILRKSIWRLYAGRSLVQRSYACAAYVILCAIALRVFIKILMDRRILSIYLTFFKY